MVKFKLSIISIISSVSAKLADDTLQINSDLVNLAQNVNALEKTVDFHVSGINLNPEENLKILQNSKILPQNFEGYLEGEPAPTKSSYRTYERTKRTLETGQNELRIVTDKNVITQQYLNNKTLTGKLLSNKISLNLEFTEGKNPKDIYYEVKNMEMDDINYEYYDNLLERSLVVT